jgi:hypothetical protein
MSYRNKRAERLQVMLTPDELDALDDWRFARRMPSRAAAIRELLRLGLSARETIPTAKGRSRDYGVVLPNQHDGGSGKGNGAGNEHQ